MAALYQDDPEYCDERDENYESCEEEDIYFCEICDREFLTEQLFDVHKQTHQVCGIDGCTFSAHPKLIEKHVNMQHRSGLYHKLKNLSKPEDIKNWINERKRKYPTRVNIELKNSEAVEKQQRGEIINEGKKQKLMKKNTKHRKRRGKKSRKFTNEDTKEIKPVEHYRGITPFRGTKYLQSQQNKEIDSSNEESIIDDSKITDDEEEERSVIKNSISITKTCNLVSENSKPIINTWNLVADYTSGSENELPDEIPIVRIESNEIEDLSKEKCETFSSKTDKINSIETIEANTRVDNIITKGHLKRKRKIDDISVNSIENMKERDMKKRKKRMLLQQLLSKSITHERNYICQCIKYIVDNNFFMENNTT